MRNDITVKETNTSTNENTQSFDEIKDHLRARYTSATEAYWHIAGYKMYGMYPTVKPLSVHMPHEQNVHINETTGEVINAVSLLQHYYARPNSDEFHDMMFACFYENYYVSLKPATQMSHDIVLNSHGHEISKRKRGICHCRFFTLLPNAGEVYYLQLLLKNVPCYSTEELYTYESQTYTTLRESALHRHLFSPISEYEEVFSSVVNLYTPEILRDLLITITMEGAPGPDLMERYFAYLTDDFIDRTPREKKRELLLDIKERLENRNRELNDFGFSNIDELDDSTRAQECNVHRNLFNEMTSDLDNEKMEIIKYCTKKLKRKKKHSTVIFIQAPAGHGKTKLACALNHKFKSLNYHVVKSAPTGLAAMLHEDGSTAHSNYRLPVNDDEVIRSEISKGSQKAKLYRNAIHMWDEAPNSHAKCIEATEALFRDIGDSQIPWGGIPLIIFFGKYFISLEKFSMHIT